MSSRGKIEHISTFNECLPASQCQHLALAISNFSPDGPVSVAPLCPRPAHARSHTHTRTPSLSATRVRREEHPTGEKNTRQEKRRPTKRVEHPTGERETPVRQKEDLPGGKAPSARGPLPSSSDDGFIFLSDSQWATTKARGWVPTRVAKANTGVPHSYKQHSPSRTLQ